RGFSFWLESALANSRLFAALGSLASGVSEDLQSLPPAGSEDLASLAGAASLESSSMKLKNAGIGFWRITVPSTTSSSLISFLISSLLFSGNHQASRPFFLRDEF